MKLKDKIKIAQTQLIGKFADEFYKALYPEISLNDENRESKAYEACFQAAEKALTTIGEMRETYHSGYRVDETGEYREVGDVEEIDEALYHAEEYWSTPLFTVKFEASSPYVAFYEGETR